jgi:hypothetical protein
MWCPFMAMPDIGLSDAGFNAGIDYDNFKEQMRNKVR